MNDGKNISIKNKRATYDYEMLDTYVTGIVLSGTEIKSLRLGKASTAIVISTTMNCSSGG